MSRKNHKKEIIQSAIDIVNEKNYEKLNMRAVAKRTGIKAASIYNHFGNKEEIIYHIILEGRLLLSKRIQQELDKHENVRDKILAYFDAFVDFGFSNKEFYKIMFMNSYPARALEAVKQDIAREIEPGLKTLAALIKDYAGIKSDEAMITAEAFFHITHGHISLSILERADFLFDVQKDRDKIKEIIINYLNSL